VAICCSEIVRLEIGMSERAEKLRAVEAFLQGLTRNNTRMMPFAPDVVLKSPLDPEHPAVGREAAVAFLEDRVFPRIPVRKAEVERHIVEGDCVATLWNATIALRNGSEVVIPIFDFFHVKDGTIKEIRPYFDPKPLKGATLTRDVLKVSVHNTQ
jgi:ketosteroid isomerase-like protein